MDHPYKYKNKSLIQFQARKEVIQSSITSIPEYLMLKQIQEEWNIETDDDLIAS